MEFLAALIVLPAFMMTWWFFGILFFLLILEDWFDYRRSAYLTVFIFYGLLLLAFQPGWWTLAIIVGLYIPIGIPYSFHRYKMWCEDTIAEYKQHSYLNPPNLDPMENMDRLIYWIVLWPISLITNIAKIIKRQVRELIKRHLIDVYTKISAPFLQQANVIRSQREAALNEKLKDN